MRASSRWLAAVLGAFFTLLPCVAHAGDADDTVFLKNGGRVRGTVIEEDPTKGLRLRVADGTIRQITPKELDHVQYASDQKQPETPAAPPVVGPPVAPAAAPEAAAEGTMRVESSEQGRVSVDGADYGRAPAQIPHLVPGRHAVSLELDGGGGIVERRVTVRAGDTTAVRMEPTSAQLAFLARNGLHFGAGAEAVFWYTGQGLFPGARAFGRLNYAAAKSLDVRVDAGLGYVSKSIPDDYLYGSGRITDRSRSIVPLTTRFDAQLNLGSVYSMSVGVDLGVAITSTSGTSKQTDTKGVTTTTNNVDTGNPALVGIHGSLLTFRVGPKREFMLSVQEGLINTFGDNGSLYFEQTISLSYLFGLGAPVAPPASQ